MWIDFEQGFDELRVEMVGKSYLTNPDILDGIKLEIMSSYGWSCISKENENFSCKMKIKDCLNDRLAELIFISLKVFDIPEHQILPTYIIQ